MEGAFKIFAPLLTLQLGRFRLHFFEVCLGKSHLIILKLQSVFLNSFNVICSSWIVIDWTCLSTRYFSITALRLTIHKPFGHTRKEGGEGSRMGGSIPTIPCAHILLPSLAQGRSAEKFWSLRRVKGCLNIGRFSSLRNLQRETINYLVPSPPRNRERTKETWSATIVLCTNLMRTKSGGRLPADDQTFAVVLSSLLTVERRVKEFINHRSASSLNERGLKCECHSWLLRAEISLFPSPLLLPHSSSPTFNWGKRNPGLDRKTSQFHLHLVRSRGHSGYL